jgi:hypothetical protein
MRWLTRLRMLIRSLFRHQRIEIDLHDGIRDHLEQEIQNNLRAGMPPDGAKIAAYQLVGSVSIYKEECRDARGNSFIESFARDLRYAIRMLRRTPLFTSVAVLTLGLGIGANTTVFTFVENMVMRSLPVRDPQQLVSLNWGESGDSLSMSYPTTSIPRPKHGFLSLVAYRHGPANLSIQARENFRIYGYEATGTTSTRSASACTGALLQSSGRRQARRKSRHRNNPPLLAEPFRGRPAGHRKVCQN